MHRDFRVRAGRMATRLKPRSPRNASKLGARLKHSPGRVEVAIFDHKVHTPRKPNGGAHVELQRERC